MNVYSKGERNTGLDLMRCISMMMVVCLHFLDFGGILRSLELGSFAYYFFYMIEAVAIVAVNLFVMLTGYFYKKKEG